MHSADSPRRFSLFSLILIFTTIAATAGWIGALRQSRDARREAIKLRRALEEHRAGVGELDVADFTRVHAVGLPVDSGKRQQWKWKVFVPSEGQPSLVLQTDKPQRVGLLAGEHLITTYIDDLADQVWLHVAVDGLPQLRSELPSYAAGDGLTISQVVGASSRSVWERAERPVLLEVRLATGNGKRRFEVWIDWMVGSGAGNP